MSNNNNHPNLGGYFNFKLNFPHSSGINIFKFSAFYVTKLELLSSQPPILLP
jgi:hypothetical protein